jgi:hypothetical protein
MGLMMDLFGWSADMFWAATAHEAMALIEARRLANKK